MNGFAGLFWHVDRWSVYDPAPGGVYYVLFQPVFAVGSSCFYAAVPGVVVPAGFYVGPVLTVFYGPVPSYDAALPVYVDPVQYVYVAVHIPSVADHNDAVAHNDGPVHSGDHRKVQYGVNFNTGEWNYIPNEKDGITSKAEIQSIKNSYAPADDCGENVF